MDVYAVIQMGSDALTTEWDAALRVRAVSGWGATKVKSSERRSACGGRTLYNPAEPLGPVDHMEPARTAELTTRVQCN